MAEKVDKTLIEGIHIFAGLNEEAIKSLVCAACESTAKTGEIIVQEGTPGHEMFLIGRGRVEVVKAAGSGREVILATLGPGESFGEMSIIEARTRSASIRAIEPSLLYSLRSEDLLELFRRWPDQYSILILNIARDLCRRLRTMDEVFAASAF